MTIPAFHAPQTADHDPQTFMVYGQFRHAEEVPERAQRLMAGGAKAGLTFQQPTDPGMEAIAAIHPPRYLHFLETIHARWTSELQDAASEVIPNLHLDRRLGGYPSAPTGLAAYHQADAACPIGPATWTGAKWAAFTAIAAAQAVLDGSQAAYALARPPGHHAYADLAGGFCFLNNSAIAAQMLRARHDRVAIVDVDVHHGNGTQGIFYGRNDVLTVSLHADPSTYYPFMCGYAHEQGEGAGVGYNVNIPLPRQTQDQSYLQALTHALTLVTAYRPGALVIALGLDAHEDDPLKGMQLSTHAFERIGMHLAGMGLPTVIVQEGGYLSDALGHNLASFFTGYQTAQPS